MLVTGMILSLLSYDSGPYLFAIGAFLELAGWIFSIFADSKEKQSKESE